MFGLWCLSLAGLRAQSDPVTDHAVRTAVATILRQVCLVPDMVVVEDPAIPTAVAYIKDKHRHIAYNATFMARLRDSTRTDWAPVSVLAHEVAHHLLGHTLDPTALMPADELACDRWSGMVLRSLGAPLDSALAALERVGGPHGTHRHPPRHLRLEALQEGWALADGPPQAPAWPSGADLRYQLAIHGDPMVYYLDAQDRVVRFDRNAEAVEVGRWVKGDGRSGPQQLTWLEQELFVDGHNVVWRPTTHGMPLKVGRLMAFARP